MLLTNILLEDAGEGAVGARVRVLLAEDSGGGGALRIVADRAFLAALMLLGAGTLAVTFADTPAAPAAAAAAPAPATSTPAATPSATAPAVAEANAAPTTAAKSSATSATTAPSAEEKRLIAAGYKPEMHGGVKLFCRSEQVVGSRLPKKVCGTPEQWKMSGDDSQHYLQDLQTRNGGGMTH